MPCGCTKEICDKLIEMMSEGATQTEVCAEVRVSEQSFRNWRTKGGPHYDSEFAEAWETAKAKQFSWWARRGRDNIGQMPFFNTPLFGLYMANMFGWRSGGASKEDEALNEIRKLKEQLGIDTDS